VQAQIRHGSAFHQFPSAFSPPPTDVGDMPLTWASFNNAPRRIQNGGWARQVTQDSFAVADTISGVNMRLTSGGIHLRAGRGPDAVEFAHRQRLHEGGAHLR
jgi:hypothetical protein